MLPLAPEQRYGAGDGPTQSIRSGVRPGRAALVVAAHLAPVRAHRLRRRLRRGHPAPPPRLTPLTTGIGPGPYGAHRSGPLLSRNHERLRPNRTPHVVGCG